MDSYSLASDAQGLYKVLTLPQSAIARANLLGTAVSIDVPLPAMRTALASWIVYLLCKDHVLTALHRLHS